MAGLSAAHGCPPWAQRKAATTAVITAEGGFPLQLRAVRPTHPATSRLPHVLFHHGASYFIMVRLISSWCVLFHHGSSYFIMVRLISSWFVGVALLTTALCRAGGCTWDGL